MYTNDIVQGTLYLGTLLDSELQWPICLKETVKSLKNREVPTNK